MQDLVLRVSSVRKETPSTRVVRVALDGQKFPYEAGQVATIGTAGRDGRVPYSIASAPAETTHHGALEFLIKLHPDGGWGTGFDVPRHGTHLNVRGPSGRFVLPNKPVETRVLFIAGGTGIAPLRSMIRQAVLTNMGMRMRLLYSARTPADFSYLRELRRMERARQIELALTASREWSTKWGGGRGRITTEHLTPLVDDPATLCLVCGPTAMVEDVPLILQTLGIAKSRIRLEEWT